MNMHTRSVVAAILCATALVLPSTVTADDVLDIDAVSAKIGKSFGRVFKDSLPPSMVSDAEKTVEGCVKIGMGIGAAAGLGAGIAATVVFAPYLIPEDFVVAPFAGMFIGAPVGAVAGAGVGGTLLGVCYTFFDMGEPLCVGVRESYTAILGEDPRTVGNDMLGKHTLFHHPTAPNLATPSPVDVSLDPRLQFGGADVDVLGLRLGIFSAENRNVYGFDFCTLLGRSLGDEYALQAGLFNLVDGSTGGLQAGLSNVSLDALYGIQTAGFANVAGGETPSYGLQAAGLVNRAGDFYGAQVGCLNAADYVAGLQVGVANMGFDRSGPKAGDVHGVQVGVVNACNSGAGLQVGLWNNARTFAGVQIGLVNVIEDHDLPFMPIVNAGF